VATLVDRYQPHGRRKTSISKRRLPAPAPLSLVPSVYVDGNFRLDNPRTFDVVTEYAEVVRQSQPTEW